MQPSGASTFFLYTTKHIIINNFRITIIMIIKSNDYEYGLNCSCITFYWILIYSGPSYQSDPVQVHIVSFIYNVNKIKAVHSILTHESMI